MFIETSAFDTTPVGHVAQLFTLRNTAGLTARITNFGGIITELHVPTAQGEFKDVVLGFSNIESYLQEPIYAGAIIGRIAGRVSKGAFSLDGHTYYLAKNEGDYHIHGGLLGFDKRLWEAEIIENEHGQALKLGYLSPDDEEGYPGNLQVYTTYQLTDDNALRITFEASTDKATPFCPTNHSYFNLAGEGSGDARNHLLQIDGQLTVDTDDDMVPTGKINQVVSGGNDLRETARLGDRLPHLFRSHGDVYLFERDNDDLSKVATVSSPENGVVMDVLTTASGMQFYTGLSLNTQLPGKSGVPYPAFSGICFECQGFSDAPNHLGFASTTLHPGENFKEVTEYRFRVG